MPPHGPALRRTAARGGALDYEPVPVRAWFEGAAFIALVRAAGGSVTPIEPFGGWIAADATRARPPHLAPFTRDLTVGRSWIEDFEGAVLVELEGTRFVAVRTEAVLSPPWIAPGLIIGAPTLQRALGLIDNVAQIAVAQLPGSIHSR